MRLMGHKIKKLRKDKGLTLERIANIHGTNASHLSRIENGKKPYVSATVMFSLSRILGTDLDYLMDDTQPIRETPNTEEKAGCHE